MKALLLLYVGAALCVFVWQAAAEDILVICRYNDDRCIGSMAIYFRNAAIWPIWATDLLLPRP